MELRVILMILISLENKKFVDSASHSFIISINKDDLVKYNSEETASAIRLETSSSISSLLDTKPTVSMVIKIFSGYQEGKRKINIIFTLCLFQYHKN